MNLQAKMLVVLAAVALLPLAVLAALEFTTTRAFADRLDRVNRESVERDLSRILSRDVAGGARILDQQAQIAGLALQIQAQAVERVLAVPPARLDAAVPVMRMLAREYGDVVSLQFAALQDGARVTYPSRALPAGYDSRRRSWYLAAERAGRRVWTPPIYSATTKRLTFITAMPVFTPGKQFAGVAAVEIAIVALLQHVAGADGGESVLVQPARDGTLRVVAERADDRRASAWAAEPKLRTIDDGGDDVQFGAVVADVDAGRSGIARLRDAGGDHLWVYAPVPTLHAALVQIVPYDAVRAAADAAGASIRHEATQQVQLSGLVALIVLGLAALVGIVVASAATRPIRDLASVAQRIGAGDFDARATVRGNDEIAAVGRAFNAMVPRLRDALRMRQSLELARAVQQNLLPLRPPAIAGFDIAGASEYCDETGGDYYDFVDLSHDGRRRVAIAVGDVSGHGIAAALVMASARAALRGAIDSITAPNRAIDRANALLCADITDGSFMTLVLLVIDPVAGNVRWVNAAHDAPLVYHVPSDAFLPLVGSDVPLGIDETWSYSEHAMAVPAGDVLVALGTDGIWETENAAGEPFGRDRWERLVRDHHTLTSEALCRTILTEVATFRGGGSAADDVTLVIVKYTAAVT